MKEVFKDIPGYEGHYQVSNLGKVKSFKWGKERILKVYIVQGYHKVSLHENRKRKKYKVHQLVAMAFLNHKIDGHKLVVDHINNLRHDNRVDNLRVVTQRDNSHTHYKGTSKYKGVSWNKLECKWKSNIYIKGKRYYLGTYDNEIEASNAYQNAIPLLR